MTVWFTADTHFGHANIIKYCERPFTNVDEMDASIIQNWNALIKDEDEVWHLGDFCFDTNRLNTYLDQLKGKLHLIHGNHDRDRVRKHHRWLSSSPQQEIQVDKIYIVLNHYSMRVWNRSHRKSIQLYGHSHGRLPGNSQSLDVGVDNWNFKPVNLSEITARLATLPPYLSQFSEASNQEDS